MSLLDKLRALLDEPDEDAVTTNDIDTDDAENDEVIDTNAIEADTDDLDPDAADEDNADDATDGSDPTDGNDATDGTDQAGDGTETPGTSGDEQSADSADQAALIRDQAALIETLKNALAQFGVDPDAMGVDTLGGSDFAAEQAITGDLLSEADMIAAYDTDAANQAAILAELEGN